jgi:exodeoxyribonuclease V beta subunit
MATGELRERVRERLLSVERALRAGENGDPVVEMLRDRGPADVGVACTRLTRALADFDAGTIATTHGFCQEALGGLGIAADLEPGVSFVEDLSDLVDEVVDDLYVRSFHRDGQPVFSRDEALMIARAAVANVDAPLSAAEGDVPARRRGLATAVRCELEDRKRRLSVMTYDDLLMRLRTALEREDGTAVAARLRARYEVVLVDEFQDTDPVQWEIMRRAFGDGAGALVLIADPKQAIYAFRGADVYAYLEAAGQAQRMATLRVNRRSDQALLDAYDALFGNARLGHEGIAYRKVSSAQPVAPRCHGTALQIRVLPRELAARGQPRFAPVARARERIAQDVAGAIVALLNSDAEVRERGAPGPESCQPVCPGDVAVLVRTNRQAGLVMQALERARVPAVINGAGSVFATAVARDWLALLEALERPTSPTRAHAAALTPFIGWPAERVAQAPEAEWEAIHERLHEWARVLRERGVATLLETVTREQRLPERLLSRLDGERRLTDLRHIGQLLHTTAMAEQLGATALTGWLRRRITDAERDSGDEERSRRLESDAQAVQVLTIHRSKGLEFPIVFVPYLWDNAWMSDTPEPVTFHDPDNDLTRTLDVALAGSDFGRHRERYIVEQRGEDLRLAYVALTRARHQAVIWWAGSRDSRNAPLTRLVFAREPDGTVPPYGSSTPTDAAAMSAFETLAAQAPGAISVERVRDVPLAEWTPPGDAVAALETARFDRALDRRWRRTSYSDITAGAHDARVGSEPEQPLLVDEPDAPVPAPAAGPGDEPATADRGSVASRLRELPAGVAAGTLVHQVFEATDFAATDLEGELERALETAPGRRAVRMADVTPVVAGLQAAIETPLGPLVAGMSLRDIARDDRLDELSFELPLAGGDQPTAMLTLDALAAALRAGLPADDPLRGYADGLEDRALRQSVRGYLTGSLDLVARVPGPDGPRFAVMDYKTNWLAEPDEPLTTWHYRLAALRTEMYGRHYGLQALLYLVALHRYLRWRLPDYDPDRHLAGVLYLFVRGMTGRDGPVVDGGRCGVFTWRPPGQVVQRLSDALDRGAGATQAETTMTGATGRP